MSPTFRNPESIACAFVFIFSGLKICSNDIDVGPLCTETIQSVSTGGVHFSFIFMELFFFLINNVVYQL